MQKPMTERERIVAALLGEPCDMVPWATRLDIWHTAVTRSGTLPKEYAGMDIMDIYRDFGIARQSYTGVTKLRLHGVDFTVEFNGEVIHKENSPAMYFPVPKEYIPPEDPGSTAMHFQTPAGRASLCFRTNETSIKEAESPYLTEHLLKNDDDFKVVKWILNHAEQEPFFDVYHSNEKIIGDNGFTIPTLGRIPFQYILLDYMGEENTIYAMMDDEAGFDYLLDAIGEHSRRALEIGLELPSPMVEFVDNFEGSVTSPILFEKYCIPYLQESAEKVHAKGKRLGSHMDGNMKPLVDLVPECGVDVVESFSPSPLTRLDFKDAWNAWKGKVIMWGAIPSPIFEPHVPEEEFEKWVAGMLKTLDGDRRIILGIGDQAVGPTIPSRVKRASELLGRKPG